MTFIYVVDGRGKNCLKTISWSPLNTYIVKTVTFDLAIFLTITNLERSSKNCLYLFEDGRGKNCSKTFLGESTENGNNSNKLWYPLTDFLLLLQELLQH